MTGLIYRKDKIGGDLTSVNDLFDPKFKGKVTMLTEMRDSVGLVAARGRASTPRRRPSTRYMQAIDKLAEGLEGRPDPRASPATSTRRTSSKGDSSAILGWSGDAVQLKADNPNIDVPAAGEGFMLFTDNMQIPVGAPHAYTAEKFIDFVYQPEVAGADRGVRELRPPVKGIKEVLAKTDPELAEQPADLPGRVPRQHAHLQDVLARRGARDRRRLPARDRRIGAAAEGSHACRPGAGRGSCRTCCSARARCGCCCSSRCRCTTWRGSRSRPGTIYTGYQFTWHFRDYTDALSNYDEQFIRSFEYAGAGHADRAPDRLSARLCDRVPRRASGGTRCCCS